VNEDTIQLHSEGSELTAATFGAGSLSQPLQTYSNRDLHLPPLLVNQACVKHHLRFLFVLSWLHVSLMIIGGWGFFSFFRASILTFCWNDISVMERSNTKKKERVLDFLMFSDNKGVVFRQKLCYLIN